jgi:hypothetical protein
MPEFEVCGCPKGAQCFCIRHKVEVPDIAPKGYRVEPIKGIFVEQDIIKDLKTKASDRHPNIRYLTEDKIYMLSNKNIYRKHFQSNIMVRLTPETGVIVIPEGTILNYDDDGDGKNDSISLSIGYRYFVKNGE